MSDLGGSDAYSPAEIARRVEAVGEAKAHMAALPLAMLLQHGGLTGDTAVTWSGIFSNLLPVILGNVLGGAVLVAGVYHVIYKRQPPT